LTDEELFDELYDLIQSLRSSIDLPMRLNRSMSPEHRQRLRRLLLEIEGVRLDAMMVRPRRSGPVNDGGISLLRSSLAALTRNDEFRAIGDETPLRLRPSPRAVLPMEHYEGLNLTDAVSLLLERIDAADSVTATPENSAASLRRVLPQQKLSPVMFDIIGGKLVTAPQPGLHELQDANNIQEARDALLSRGEAIIEALKQSNCDRRVIDSLREIHEAISTGDNIISLGLLNVGLSQVCKSAAAELPDALAGAIDGHSMGISLYVAQFPAWQRFAENAAAVELSADDVAQISATARSIAQQLESEPALADASVPKTIRALAALVSSPSQTTKRAAFALLRTVENLVARIYTYGADLLDQTAKKAISGLSTVASAAVIGSLMAIALNATASLGPVTGRVGEAAWMRTAAAIVERQIEALSK
jgi:hypothetical protein